MLAEALTLARSGFHVFPLIANTKNPAIKSFPTKATRDEAQIRRWFEGKDRNVGISTTRFGDDEALIVIDVDNKHGKRGDESLFALDLAGNDCPVTRTQTTPTGGKHLIYRCPTAMKQGVNVLGDGLDIRSAGGYIVGAGSLIDEKPYSIDANGVVPAPAWLVQRLGVAKKRDLVESTSAADRDRATARAMKYLETAPRSTEGDGGDLTAFKVAARLKDLGCVADQALELMLDNWNDDCEPPWDAEDLRAKVGNAFGYGKDMPGIAAPEVIFTAVQPAPAAEPEAERGHPFEEMNKEFAFIKKGGFVLQETTDDRGRFSTEHLSLPEFHGWFANKTIQIGDRPTPMSKPWMSWGGRREYEAVVFKPAQECGPRWYNLWRGFSVEPAEAGAHPAVAQFLEHALKNVCGGDEDLCRWLIGYFAHMIQRPGEKPLVALVFKGKKGTGKNALVERVGALLGDHFLVADDDRYLLSNFNSHFENNLFIALDEASWAGDKRAEGKLKGLITGTRHNIERKGAEPYRVDNLTRVAIIGNEDWLVPATADERRFAVFNVGDGRRQDRQFFESMRKGMEAGGYAHLLRYLLDFDLADVDVNDAPATEGLAEQKIASLEPIEQWWYGCLEAGEILNGDFGGEWPDRISGKRLLDSLGRYYKARNIRSRLPDKIAFGRRLKTMAPNFHRKKAQMPNGEGTWGYFTPGLKDLRNDWDAYIGAAFEWDDDNEPASVF